MQPHFDHCRIAGIPIVTASRSALAEAMVRDCRKGKPPLLVFDANGHALSLRETDAAYRQALDDADIVHADGGFLVTLSKWFTRHPIAERSCTTDLIHDVARKAAADGLSFYLLGGSEEVNAECARRLALLYPGLRIAGRRNGFFSADEEPAVIAGINVAHPDIIWVGLGKPREQIFAAHWRDQVRAGWLVTCGGCFNYITGDYRRAPLWMQHANLEWLHRLATRPRQLFRRYLVTTPHALWLALSHIERGVR
jgi:exopolysaccharide biosynthesis WecB/TagA/CpsF family protein